MSANSEDILQELLMLPVETRARLAEQLLESLEPPNERNQHLWAEEADRRIEAYRRGEIKAIPAEEVFARLREKFPRK